MAAAGSRMRLTVEVLPLQAENAHGPYQAAALAAFKGRKFALPVQLEHNFEQVWSQIEDRYKRNYLTPAQATSFTIKKLQDAYDCDLDLGDTVGSIFEGETDPQMRLIKVIPSFVNRDFSVPFTSNLRPGHAQKRLREINAAHTNKRRRLGEEEDERQTLMNMDAAPDQPVPSTESENSGDIDVRDLNARIIQRNGEQNRTKSGSVVLVQDSQTGGHEFGATVKEESPELGTPAARTIPDSESPQQTFKKPRLPASKIPLLRRSSLPRSKPPRQLSRETRDRRSVSRGVRDNQHGTDDVQTHSSHVLGAPGPFISPELDSQGAIIDQSPKSTPEQSETVPIREAPERRRNLYSVPSSPEFVQPQKKTTKTYGKNLRTPRKPKLVQMAVDEQVDLLNSARTRPSNACSFRIPEPDAISSTSQESPAYVSRREVRNELGNIDGDEHENVMNSISEDLDHGIRTLEENYVLGPEKSSSLKRPTRRSYEMPSATPGPRKAGRPRLTPRPVKGVPRSRGRPRKTASSPPALQPRMAGRIQSVPELKPAKPRSSSSFSSFSSSPSSSPPPGPGSKGEPETITLSSTKSSVYSDYKGEGQNSGEIAQISQDGQKTIEPIPTTTQTSLEMEDEGGGNKKLEHAHEASAAEYLPDINAGQRTPSDEEAQIDAQFERDTGFNAVEALKQPQSRAETLLKSESKEQEEGNSASKAESCGPQSWSFAEIGQQKDITEKFNEGNTSKSHPGMPLVTEFGELSQSNNDLEDVEQSKSKSRSFSGADSARSTPAAAARYLSRSPTSNRSDDEDESKASSAVSRAVSPLSGSEKDESSSLEVESEAEDENIGKPIDAVIETETAPPSSPPVPVASQIQQSTTLARKTTELSQNQTRTPNSQSLSQTPPHSAQLPLSSQGRTTQHNTPRSATFRSSQSVSQLAAQRRRGAKYGFPSLKEKLRDMQTGSSNRNQTAKIFDPKTRSLSRLLKAKEPQKSGVTSLLEESDSSGDESSSSSSSSSNSNDSENETKT